MSLRLIPGIPPLSPQRSQRITDCYEAGKALKLNSPRLLPQGFSRRRLGHREFLCALRVLSLRLNSVIRDEGRWHSRAWGKSPTRDITDRVQIPEEMNRTEKKLGVTRPE